MNLNLLLRISINLFIVKIITFMNMVKIWLAVDHIQLVQIYGIQTNWFIDLKNI